MLSFDENKTISKLADRYEKKRGACVEALKMVQRWRGWISDEDLNDVARCLDMSADELDGVATFYNLIFRHPVGWHTILICDSVSCWIMGCSALRDHLEKELHLKLGETTADGRFTLLPTACLGACDHAPVIMIDGDLHGDLSPGKLSEALASYR
ncbi:NADH-quinone oxidoreductase subunit NuoE [Methylocystis sp. IM3]|uniref:NADH-quinone oxidoreductase subunit NuoE n=1 Tax=unclassified Methylocystis TaxID=2625913 RepID=UPI0030F87DF5